MLKNVCEPVMSYTLGLLASWVIVPAEGSGDGSPQSIDAVKSLASNPPLPRMVGIGAVNVPTS